MAFLFSKVRWSVAIVITVIILGLGITAFYKRSGSHTLDWTGRANVTITLGSSGFEPNSIYITRGTNVTFRTTQRQPFWPASNLHPFHTIYPQFDPRRPLAADETWSFVFDKDGRWMYHDHIDPVVTGVIIVVPPGAEGNETYDVLAPCDQAESSGRQACWQEYLHFALEKDGIAAALDELSTLYRSYPEFASNCHNYAHDLGLLAYIRYGDSVPLVYQAIYCGQGFYHGYMEGFLSGDRGNTASASAYCDRVGAQYKDSYPLLGPQCMHGIGHGYMEYLLSTRGDLINDLPRLVSLAIAGCSVLPDDDTRFRCASGAYAVLKDWINIQKLAPHYSQYFSAEDPFTLCAAVPEEWAKRACAWEFSKEALILNYFNAANTFKSIHRSGTAWAPEYVPSMYTSAAFLIGERNVSAADTRLAGSCAEIDDRVLKIACIQGIVNGLLFNGDPENEMRRSSSFCRTTALDAYEQSACAEVVIRYMSQAYGSAKTEQVCRVFSDILIDSKACLL